jgi:hypothetical protein
MIKVGVGTRVRWWHAAAFYAVLLLGLTVVSHALRSPPGQSSDVGAPSAQFPSASATSRPSASTSAAVSRSAVAPTSPRSRGSVRERVVAAGVILPDHAATPGAVDPAVTQADIGSTICRTGYTATVRPDAAYTTAVKLSQLRAGYSYRGDTRAADYEEDHLIALELGGSPTSAKNLWPEPYAARDGARVKDKIENKLHELVCSRTLSLRSAQRAIAANWWAAYRSYMAVSIAPTRTAAPPTHSRPPPAPRATTPVSAAPAQHGCTTTASGSCIRGGEFCPQADYGMTGYDADGTPYVCKGDSTHPHWES